MTDNHNYETPEKGATEWHESLNRNFRYIDRDIEIRDIDAAKTDYRPKSGAKFLATDTENVYVGDGSQWLRLATSGENPLFDTVSAKTLVDRESGSSYSVDQLAGDSQNDTTQLTADATVTLESGTPTAYDRFGSRLSQDDDALPVLQTAVDSVDSSGGGEVVIGEGTFPLNKTDSYQELVTYSNLTIRGQGMGATVLKCEEQTKIGGASVESLHYRDFTFDGQNHGERTTINDGQPYRCSAVRVAVLNAGSRSTNRSKGGLNFRGDRGYNKIINCYAENCSYVSFSTQKLGRYNQISGCIVKDPNESGGFTHPISIESNVNSVASNNTVIGSSDGSTTAGSPCINANAVRGCVVSNNNIIYGFKGIGVSNGGIDPFGSQDGFPAGVVVDGNFIQNTYEGIEIQKTSTEIAPEDVIISNNLIRDGGNKGIQINNEARASIVGNTILRQGGRGIDGNNIGGPCKIQNNTVWTPDGQSSRAIVLSAYDSDTKYNSEVEPSIVSGNHCKNGEVLLRPRCAVVGNVVTEPGDNAFAQIKLENSADKSTVVGNIGERAINIDSQENVVVGNNTSNLLLSSNQAEVTANRGYTANNSGSASVADGDTIAHGLNGTPSYVNLTTSVQGHIASASSVGSSNITVELVDNSGSAVGSAETVYWEAGI